MIRTGATIALRTLLAPGVVLGRLVAQTRRPVVDGLPVPPRSLAIAWKTALDEVFFLSEALSAPFVSPWDGARILAELADAIALYGAAGWLDAPDAYHPTPPPLRTATRGAGRSRGLDYEHLEFASEYEPHPSEPGRDRWLGYTPNRRAHAWLLRHPGPPRPWLVCLHGYRMGFPFADFLAFPAAWFHRELGLNVAFPVLPLHGPRKVGWRTGDGFLSGEYLDTVHLHAQAMWDVRRLVGWLRTEAEAPAIGVYGLSLGAYSAALLVGLEPGLDCVVAGLPPACYVDLARWNVPAAVLAVGQRLGLASWAHVTAVLRVISPLGLAPRIPRERLFIYAAMADRLVPPAAARTLWRHWREPRLAWYPGSHVSFGWQPEVRAILHEAFTTTGLLA